MKKILLTFGILSITLYANPINSYMETLKVQAKKENQNFSDFSAVRGKEIFFKELIGKREKKVSCASCHTNDLTKTGENIFTGKKIKPLSPKVNPKRFTNVKKVKKWLRRNFKDVYKREGTALEKGDVLYFMMGVQK